LTRHPCKGLGVAINDFHRDGWPDILVAQRFRRLDNDGFIDLVVNVKDGPALLLRNQGGHGNHWLPSARLASGAIGTALAASFASWPGMGRNSAATSQHQAGIYLPMTWARREL
jgi:hypothetical protein